MQPISVKVRMNNMENKKVDKSTTYTYNYYKLSDALDEMKGLSKS